MKKFLVLFLSLLLVTGCANDKKVANADHPGKIVSINYDKMKNKIKDKETFIVVIEQEGCHYCENYNKTLKKYLKNHHVKIYTIDLRAENNPQKTYDTIKNKYEKVKKGQDAFLGTPHTFIFEKGKLKESLSGERELDEVKDVIDDYDLYIK